jgi:hypothetical protein
MAFETTAPFECRVDDRLAELRLYVSVTAQTQGVDLTRDQLLVGLTVRIVA